MKQPSNSFNLDSYKVLLSGAYINILKCDGNLDKLEEYLMSDETLGEMSEGKMIDLHKSMTARQRVNVALTTQLLGVANRNEQIKLLLEELTKIKEASSKRDSVPQIPVKTQNLIAGLQKAMEDLYNQSVLGDIKDVTIDASLTDVEDNEEDIEEP